MKYVYLNFRSINTEIGKKLCLCLHFVSKKVKQAFTLKPRQHNFPINVNLLQYEKKFNSKQTFGRKV